MTPEEILSTLQPWFEEKTGAAVPAESPYADVPAVDSLDVLELITFAEDTFGLRFSASDFEDRRFATLAGLATLIHERKGAQ